MYYYYIIIMMINIYVAVNIKVMTIMKHVEFQQLKVGNNIY